MVRTGSCRAHPRSLAGAGTTAPCSGQLRGRGVSQCQPLRTLRTSRIAPPTVSAKRVRPPSPEYQGMSADPAVHTSGCCLSFRCGAIVGPHDGLEILALPEHNVGWDAPVRDGGDCGILAEAGARALGQLAAGGRAKM